MGFRTSIWLAAALVTAVFPLAAAAGERNAASRPLAVVELFTSQGCNSCPPADAMFSALAERGDVVALSYHVDYWDYLGWSDTLATPENSERQNAYSRAFGNRSVYTPQFIVNGRKHMSGAKTHSVDAALASLARKGAGMSVDVSASYTEDSLVIEAGEGSGGEKKAHVVLAFFDPVETVQIKGGKNGGRTFVYRNSVSAAQGIGIWHGKSARFELPMSELIKKNSGGCAILLQQVGKDGAPGAILGATIVVMPSS